MHPATSRWGVDAILKFCAKTDPRLAASAERHLTVLTGVASPEHGVRQYKQGYDLVSDALAKVSKPTALTACSVLASPPSDKGERGRTVGRARRRLQKMDVIVPRTRLKGFAVGWDACAWLCHRSPLPTRHRRARRRSGRESVINYCGPIDPAATDRLRQMIKQVVQGASEQQLAEVRKSDEYRKAYDSVVDFVGKIDQHNAKQFCSEAPIERK